MWLSFIGLTSLIPLPVSAHILSPQKSYVMTLAERFNQSKLTDQQKKRLQQHFSNTLPGLYLQQENETPWTSLDLATLPTRPTYLHGFVMEPSPFADTFLYLPPPSTLTSRQWAKSLPMPKETPFVCGFCNSVTMNQRPGIVLQLLSRANPWFPVCVPCAEESCPSLIPPLPTNGGLPISSCQKEHQQ